MNKEKNNGVFADLLASGYSNDRYEALRLIAHQETTCFMGAVADGTIDIEDDLTPLSHKPHLDQWVAENDDMLTMLVRDIQTQISDVVQYALPAHDERQIFFKDAAEGLRLDQMEQPQGYKATFQIAMNFHDWGRFWEGFFYDPINNPPENWIPHSQLSFLLLKQTLDQPPYKKMPQELKNHFLYAVLAHSGDNGKSYMSRAVQTCDRMQLIGAEGFYRALSYCVCLMNGQIKYPDDASYQYTLPDTFDDHKSVLSLLEYCSRNMRENIGDEHSSWQRRIAVENVALLKAACEGDEDLAGRMFAPELDHDGAFGPKKRKIDAGILKEAADLYHSSKDGFDLRWSPYEVASIAIEAIEMPLGAARLSDNMKKSIHRAFGEMSDIQRKSLFRMMIMANIFRAEQDEIDRDICLKLADDPRGYIRAIASVAQKYTERASVAAPGMELNSVNATSLSITPPVPIL